MSKKNIDTIDTKNTIFLIDGSSLLYRGYYGMHPLHTSQGVPVQAVYSFCRMIKKLIDIFNPEYMALVWDSKGKTTRHELFPAYKATRQDPPRDLFTQKEYIVTFANLIGILQVAQEGVEADDLIFSLAQEQVNDGNNIVVITSDKDMGQMITEHISIYDPLKEEIYKVSNFTEKIGMPISKLPFYFALLGDASDNIPGVHGIGKKTALELVNTFDSLNALYEQLDHVKTKRARTALQDNKDNAFLSQTLFLLQYHATGLKKKSFAFDIANWEKGFPLFKELEFTSLLKNSIATKKEPAIALDDILVILKKRDFQLVTTENQLTQLCSQLKKNNAFAFDTETTGIPALEVDLVGISFCTQEGQAFYVACGHNTNETQLDINTVVAQVNSLFMDATITKYAHNLKYDQLVLANHGITLQGPVFDTYVAASLITKSWQSASLKNLSAHYFNEPMITYEQIMGDNKYKNFSDVPLTDALLYAANDAHQTFRLVPLLKKELQTYDLDTLFNTIENPLIQVLYEMEKEGIILDVKELAHANKIVTDDVLAIEQQINSLIGFSINLNSPKQVSELLFEKLALTPIKKSSKGGGYSTDQEVLTQLAQQHPIPGLIVKYRELAKLKSTYLDALPTYINKNTGRIHTSFSQTRVATGRLSSTDPNMQNIPNNGYGIAIRGAFKPPKGHLFISADYSQIELRVLAHLSQDTRLIQAFRDGKDIHAQTAALIFDTSLEMVTHDQRQMGKKINFSILYGLTPYGLSKDLNIPFKDAKKFIEKYFAQYPGVLAWMEKVITFTKDNGFIRTFWGRRRDIPGIYETNKVLYDEAKRIAINTVAQGTSAEIMKQGMINLRATFQKNAIKANIILQIHDELLVSVVEEQCKEAEQLMIAVLDAVVNWSIPFIVTTRVGHDWQQVSK